MPLPHYTQLSNVGSPGGPGTLPDEAVYLSLWEVSIILPPILVAQGRDPYLLLENITKAPAITLTTDHGVANAQQRFKVSTREFLTVPKETSGKFTLTYQVNVNQQGSMETWNTFKAWYDLLFNSQNGTMHYKSDMISNIIFNQHDKKGVVLRRIQFINCQLQKMNTPAFDWKSQAIWDELTADFVFDYFVDEYIDQGNQIVPALVDGY